VPSIGVAVRAAGIYLAWQNVAVVTINYIPMDVELLFSRSPFADQAGRSRSPGQRRRGRSSFARARRG
jgi:hypothetical protein